MSEAIDTYAPRRSWVWGALYAVTAYAIILYVAVCSLNWDEAQGADAWEHMAVVFHLAADLTGGGENPNVLDPAPSVRYSPYSLALALVVRTTGADPYRVLCAAAVVNTALLLLGIWMLLRTYGRGSAAFTVLLCAVGLWGVPPGYANTLALADLPWHQVNPSALSIPLILFAWALFRRFEGAWWTWPIAIMLMTVAMLSHGMSGAFGLGALLCLSVVTPGPIRARCVIGAIIVCIGVAALCFAWPMYSFLEALTIKRDREYWFNPSVLRLLFFAWTPPAVLLTIMTLGQWRREVFRFCLLAAAGCFALALASAVLRSPTFARLPIPAMLLLHICIGIVLHEHGVFDPTAWPRLVRGVLTRSWQSTLMVIAGVLVVAHIVPQCITILSSPHLARPYIARALGKEDKQRHFLEQYRTLLADTTPGEVAMGRMMVSWPTSIVGVRSIARLHYELFVEDMAHRTESVHEFFDPDTSQDKRRAIIKEFNAKWIVLARNEEVIEPRAVVAETEDLLLLDAARWLDDTAPEPAN